MAGEALTHAPNPAPKSTAAGGAAVGERISRRDSLQTRTLILIGLLITLISVTFTAWSVYSTHRLAEEALIRRAKLLAEMQAKILAKAFWELDNDMVEATLKSIEIEPDFLGALVVNEYGEVTSSVGDIVRQSDVIRLEQRIVFEAGAETHAIGILELRLARDNLNALLIEDIGRGLIQFALLLGGIVGAVYWVLRIVTQPLDQMTRVMVRLATGRHDAEVPALDRRDEIGAMARALQIFKDNAVALTGVRGELERANVQFTEAIDAFPDGFAYFGTDGRLVIMNDQFLKLFGDYGKEIRSGLSFEDIYRAFVNRYCVDRSIIDRNKMVEERLQQFMAGKGAVEIYYPNGLWVRVNERRSSNGGTVGVYTNITDAKRRQAEMTAQAALLQTTLASISDGISVTDGQGRLVAWNQRYFEMRQLPTRFAVHGLPYAIIARFFAERGDYGTGSVEAHVAKRMEQLADPQASQTEMRIGDGRILEVRRNPMPNGGQVSLYHDVTDLRRRETELQFARERAEAANRDLEIKATELELANARLRELDDLKSNFVSTVSHELRTPLTSVRGFAAVVKREFARHFHDLAQTDPKLAQRAGRIVENLGIIELEGERLTRLINDMLDLAKIEAGRVEWRDQDCNLPDIARAAAATVSAQFHAKPRITFQMRIDESVPPIIIDRDRIQQVIINLLNNAAKFTEEGEVDLSLTQPEPGWVDVTVRDTGTGIPADHLDAVFEKFRQVTTPGESAKAGGTGLGLAICREIVEHYQGRIWVNSELGKGSAFHFRLPLNRAAAAAAAAKPAAPTAA